MRPITRRTFGKTALAATAAVAAPAIIAKAGESPIKVGFSMALTGALAGGGKSALVGLEMWRDDTNAAGGLLGRKIELVYYDDQTRPNTVPGIYAKLLDIDKVDLVLLPYGTNLAAPVLPMLRERKRFIIGQLELGLNDTVMYDRFFEIAPWGPKSGSDWCRGYFDIAKRHGFKSVAIVNSDAEFSATAAKAGARIAEEYGMKVVSTQHYPPNSVDFSGILRNVNAASPDFVFVASYPVESAALVRGVSEIGMNDNLQMIGGAMVGLQYAQSLENLGSALNGWVNYDFFVVASTLKFPGIESFLSRYTKVAAEQKIDTLGHYLPPYCYAGGQLISAAVKAVKSLDEGKMAKWLHANTVNTIVGPITFGPDGNWSTNRMIWSQFRDVKDKDVDQFRKEGHQIVLQPESLASGKMITPFKKAHA